jgi:type I restriction enzyme R subunit
MLQIQEMPTLAHLVRRIVGMDRNAAKTAFATFLNDRSLTAPQIRFVELVIDQLTARGFMEPAALYEAPFSSIHAGGPDELFAGKPNIIDGLFHALEETLPRVITSK